jgi:Bacterial regulatory proteins, luxR family
VGCPRAVMLPAVKFEQDSRQVHKRRLAEPAGAHTKVSSRASPSSSASSSSRRGTNPTPNPRIAERLVVSLDTVKRHVSYLPGKLGAANRTEAVTRARQLGLIP